MRGKKALRLLVQRLLGINLADYQQEIVEAIVYRTYEHLLITAATQAGKSYAVALGIVIFAALNPREKIVLIAPTREQARIIMRYVFDIFGRSDELSSVLDTDTRSHVERLKHEMRKSMLRLTNDTTIQILSAEGGLLGFSATVLILDESAEIDDETYRTQILRMLGAEEGVRKVLIEISTPHRRNHFFDSFNNPDVQTIQIDWKRAVEEGRLREDFIAKQRETLMPDEFACWYGAEFPDEGTKSVFPLSYIERAQALHVNKKVPYDYYTIGVDVARMGKDASVYTVLGKKGDAYNVVEILYHEKKPLTHLIGQSIKLMEKYKPKYVGIDDTGMGGGPIDVLQEKGYNVSPFIAGRRPKDKKRFMNLKAEAYIFVRKLMEDGLLGIPGNRFLIRDLIAIEREFTSDGKNRIVDPAKSPDFSDSLVYGIYAEHMNEEAGVIEIGY